MNGASGSGETGFRPVELGFGWPAINPVGGGFPQAVPVVSTHEEGGNEGGGDEGEGDEGAGNEGGGTGHVGVRPGEEGQIP